MNYTTYIGKVLADKENNKIGQVIDLLKTLESGSVENGKKDKLVIKVELSFGRQKIILIDASKIFKIKDYYAWADITRKEVKALIKKGLKLDDDEKPYPELDLTILKNFRAPPPSS